jgi:hypothetical protein
MHAVVNHLPIKPGTDWTALACEVEKFRASAAAHAGFRDMKFIRCHDKDEAIVLVFFDSRPVLEDLSSRLAGPWFAEHVRPHLAGPAARSTGEVLAG